MAKKKVTKRKSVSGGGTPPKPSHVRDVKAIGKDAATAAERRAVLMWALANDWNTADIDTLERIDTDDWHGFSMWVRA